MGGLVVAALPGLGAVAAQPERRRPNFVVVLCDDLGWGDIEPHGGSIPTPAISQLARQGLDATDYYAPANLGTPSRAGILTGRYPVRTGLAYEALDGEDERVLPPAEITIAAALRPEYASALIGKWGLGHSGPDWLPTRHGFDTFYGIASSHDAASLAVHDADAATGETTSAPADLPNLQQQFYARAERFLDAHRERPFFLELALASPRLPAHPNAVFAGKSEWGAYGDLVMEIDSIVGRLIAKLRALQLDQDTVVILTSDNGAGFEGSNGPFRDRKGGAGYDGGYRVPFIAWGPGIVKPVKTDALLSGIDLLPTFVSMAGLALPPGIELDGLDVSKVLARGMPAGHDEILLFDHEDVAGVRTRQWKYVERTSYRNRPVSYRAAGYDELYDMVRDRGETYSVAATNPYVVEDMKRRLERARSTFAPFKRGRSGD